MFVMWDEKVESDCSMLCSSPISAKTRSKTESSLLSPAGIMSPHIAMSENRPSVLIETVFPPVFGPVMMSESKSVPSLMSVATTFFGSMSG